MPGEATTWEAEPAAVWEERWRVPRVVLFAQTASTNDVARQLAAERTPAGTVVIADEQSAGRGRFGRRWTAPPGTALLISIVLRPGTEPHRTMLPSTAPIRVGLAAAAAVERVTGISPRLKWPNDLVVPGHGKLGGILCETGTLPDPGGYWVVAGIGINTGQTADDFDGELVETATSIRRLTGQAPPRAAIAGALIDHLRPFTLQGLRPLQPDELDEYARRDALRGAYIQAGPHTGTADGLADDGALRLVTSAGLRLIHAGSVRPASAAPLQAAPTDT